MLNSTRMLTYCGQKWLEIEKLLLLRVPLKIVLSVLPARMTEKCNHAITLTTKDEKQLF